MDQICTCGAKMKRTEWHVEWKCDKCGEVRIDHNDDEYDYDNLYEDKSECCQNCPNEGLYPNCVDGCSIL